jgi:tripartite-type tricarboxylate transporter receptor subunit TctC
MRLSRRKLLSMAVVSVPLLPHVALAEDYPVRPARVVLGLSPGGSVDIVTRIVAQALSEFLGQQFIVIVENKPGAKANPGKLSYASGGTGSSLHVIGELFNYLR